MIRPQTAIHGFLVCMKTPLYFPEVMMMSQGQDTMMSPGQGMMMSPGRDMMMSPGRNIMMMSPEVK